jgi:hypothetical protein
VDNEDRRQCVATSSQSSQPPSFSNLLVTCHLSLFPAACISCHGGLAIRRCLACSRLPSPRKRRLQHRIPYGRQRGFRHDPSANKRIPRWLTRHLHHCEHMKKASHSWANKAAWSTKIVMLRLRRGSCELLQTMRTRDWSRGQGISPALLSTYIFAAG